MEIYQHIKQSKFSVDISNLIGLLCKPGYTCLDIGSNYGYTSILLLKKVGVTGKVYSWEPNKFLFENYLLNVKTHNITYYNNAVSDVVGKSDYYVFSKEGNPACYNTLDKRKRDKVLKNKISKSYKTQVIKTETLDYWWKKKNKPCIDLIKIDVEGYEEKVVHGSYNLLKTYSPILIIEFHSKNKFHTCKKFLKQLNYSYNSNVSIAEQSVFMKN